MIRKILICAAMLAPLSPAHAATLLFNVSKAGVTLETFSLDDSSALSDSIPGYLFFNLLTDSQGNNSAYFGDANTGNNFGTGLKRAGDNSVFPIYNDSTSATLYSGSGLRLSFGAGSSFTTAAGNLVSVSGAVPEPATWAMMIFGVAGVGLAMRRRNNVHTTVFYA